MYIVISMQRKRITWSLTLLCFWAINLPLWGQTNWSKVSVNFSNQCNVYSFELQGVSDTCFSQFETEFVDQYADPVYRTFSKKFNVVFPDTGSYYGTILVKNKCGRDDSTIYLTLKVGCKPLKCNWFSAKLKQYNQNRYYQWQLENIYPDSCLNYQYRFYNYQTGKTDTGKHYNGLCNYTFPSPGKFKMSLSIWNQCRNCDTLFVKELNILSFAAANLTTQQTHCDSLTARMSLVASDPKDTCWKHYYLIYSDATLDTIGSARWNDPANLSIYKQYAFPDSGLIYGSSKGRLLEYRFPRKGRYILRAQWSHQCFSQDTLIYARFEIPDCYAGITNMAPPKEAPWQILNTLGQPLSEGESLPKNQLLLFRYKRGTTQKVIIRE